MSAFLSHACLLSSLILTALCLGILAVRGTVQIWHVLFFAALSGLFASFDMPTRQSFIAEMVGKEDLPSAVALNSSVFNAARALGPAVAGLLLKVGVSIGVAFLGNAALSLAVIAGLLLIRVPPRPTGDASKVDNSLRGVWGVVLVGLVGRWFGNTERRDAGTRTLWFRFAGAALILLAVVLTFTNANPPTAPASPTHPY